MTDDELDPAVVAAVLAHMNIDHAGDSVTICRGVGQRPQTTAAQMTNVDRLGVELVATGSDGDERIRIPFTEPITDRAQIRTEVVRMVQESAAQLGLPGPQH